MEFLLDIVYIEDIKKYVDIILFSGVMFNFLIVKKEGCIDFFKYMWVV